MNILYFILAAPLIAVCIYMVLVILYLVLITVGAFWLSMAYISTEWLTRALNVRNIFKEVYDIFDHDISYDGWILAYKKAKDIILNDYLGIKYNINVSEYKPGYKPENYQDFYFNSGFSLTRYINKICNR